MRLVNYERVRPFPVIPPALGQLYEQPQNLELWMRLAELFHAQGEKTQEYYCRAYIQTLKR